MAIKVAENNIFMMKDVVHTICIPIFEFWGHTEFSIVYLIKATFFN